MSAGGRRGVPPVVWIGAVVLVTTASALVPLHQPRLPGTLHLGVVQGIDPTTLERALGPLAQYLGAAVRRTAEVEVLAPDQLLRRADLMILPTATAQRLADVEILSWVRPVSGSGSDALPVLVRRRGVDPVRAIAAGDSTVMGGERALRADLQRRGLSDFDLSFGASPYDHREALHLLRHGVVDAAVVMRAAVVRALATGSLRAEDVEILRLVPARPHLALVAGPSLSAPARRELRAAALNLDHFRFDPTHDVAAAILPAMAEVGIGGFVPVDPLPALRP